MNIECHKNALGQEQRQTYLYISKMLECIIQSRNVHNTAVSMEANC